ncbi:MAG: hypothetical protein K2I79_00230, partial [Clostridia bacterium]|nr:hypothetical protein [Clostridia bacterium]
QQEAEAKRIAREEEAEARRIAREEELEAKRAAWEEEERQERLRRMHWEEEEREVRRRENDRREKRYREEYEKREEELFRRDEAMKMMFATMLNNMKADIPRASAQNTSAIVREVMAELLPAIQQMIPQAVQQMVPQSSEGGKEIVYIPYPVGDTEESAATGKTAHKHSKSKAVKAEEEAAATIAEPVKAAAVSDSVVKEEISTPAEPVHIAPIKSEKDIDDEDGDIDEEWDYDEEDWDMPDAEQVGEDGKTRRRAVNFRQRLKFSSDKNRELYTQLKNVFCAQRNVAYRVCGSVEKIKYHNDLIAVIGVAKRSLKLWLALDPAQFDEERYYHKDVSDKARFASVPMYVKVGSGRAFNRAMELLGVLFEKFAIESKRRYVDKPLQELIFTLRGNKLLKDKANKGLLCEAIHVHDADILSDETAQNCIEYKDI